MKKMTFRTFISFSSVAILIQATMLTPSFAKPNADTVSVNYRCTSNNTKLNIRYTFKQNKPEAAIIRYKGKTLTLPYNPKAVNADTSNQYDDGTYQWDSGAVFTKADAKTAATGNMFSKGDAILAKYCEITK